MERSGINEAVITQKRVKRRTCIFDNSTKLMWNARMDGLLNNFTFNPLIHVHRPFTFLHNNIHVYISISAYYTICVYMYVYENIHIHFKKVSYRKINIKIKFLSENIKHFLSAHEVCRPTYMISMRVFRHMSVEVKYLNCKVEVIGL